MKSLLPEKYHHSIYTFSLIILVIGLPTSKFLISISQIILAANWLLEGNVKNKFIAFWNNKTAVIISSTLLLHFIGLLYSDDIEYALKDIRIKFPLLFLPILLSTSKPLSEKVVNIILQFFIATVLYTTIVSTLIYTGLYTNSHVAERGISIFISHIRFALLICIAVFILGYYMYNIKNRLQQIICILIIAWFTYFLTLLGSLTGLIVLPVTVFLLLTIYLFKSKKGMLRLGGFVFLLSSALTSFYFVRYILHENNRYEIVDFSKLNKHTRQGNLYEHDSITKAYENGNLIWIYYCKNELEESWNKRSDIKIGNQDLKGNDLYNTLIRFLTSKGMRKDAEAVASLEESEIKAIENGVANVNYQNMSDAKIRIYETLWEVELYKNTGDANGHSLTQRFEYWKTAFSIIKQHPFLGVGTGDLPLAFEQEYNKLDSSLTAKWRLRSHNQYLSIAIAFGGFGLLWFIIALIYPLFTYGKQLDYLYVAFLLIAFISFFTEDTLETQTGVTFFAFFNSFFLFVFRRHEA